MGDTPSPADHTAPLFDLLPPPVGPVWTACSRSLRAAVLAGRLDEDRDALGIAHLAALATAMDGPAARDPRSLTLLSRELRTVAETLGLRLAPPAEKADPFGFLRAETLPGMSDDAPPGT